LALFTEHHHGQSHHRRTEGCRSQGQWPAAQEQHQQTRQSLDCVRSLYQHQETRHVSMSDFESS
jgi:hypothetical protein